jgi:RNA polymerase primary sigma factor
MKSNIGEHDLVKVYLNQMSTIPPVSLEEERSLAKVIEDKRQEFRRKVLESPIAARCALRLYRRMVEGELPLERVVLMDNTKEDRDFILRSMLDIAPRVSELLHLNEESFREYIGDLTNSGDRVRIRKQMKKQVQRAVELLDAFPLQISRIEPVAERVRGCFDRIKKIRRRLGRVQRKKNSEVEIQRLHEELLELQISAQQNPRGMRRYLRRLRRLRKEYEQAKAALGQKNLRLVVSIAKNFRNKGLPFLDLIQEGNTGLMKALDRYEVSRGHKFSTYATWWIKQTITRSIAYQSRTVRIPIHAINNLNRVMQKRDDFLKQCGREPTLYELSGIVELKTDEIRRLFNLGKTSLSLDQPCGQDDDGYFSDFLEDSTNLTPVDLSQRSLLKERIGQILKTLTPREREVLKMRFGLGDGSTHTLEEVGLRFNVSRERIRQIESCALQKLQLPKPRSMLEGFWRECSGN